MILRPATSNSGRKCKLNAMRASNCIAATAAVALILSPVFVVGEDSQDNPFEAALSRNKEALTVNASASLITVELF